MVAHSSGLLILGICSKQSVECGPGGSLEFTLNNRSEATKANKVNFKHLKCDHRKGISVYKPGFYCDSWRFEKKTNLVSYLKYHDLKQKTDVIYKKRYYEIDGFIL